MAEYDFIKMQKKLSKYLDEDRFAAYARCYVYLCLAGNGPRI